MNRSDPRNPPVEFANIIPSMQYQSVDIVDSFDFDASDQSGRERFRQNYYGNLPGRLESQSAPNFTYFSPSEPRSVHNPVPRQPNGTTHDQPHYYNVIGTHHSNFENAHPIPYSNSEAYTKSRTDHYQNVRGSNRRNEWSDAEVHPYIDYDAPDYLKVQELQTSYPMEPPFRGPVEHSNYRQFDHAPTDHRPYHNIPPRSKFGEQRSEHLTERSQYIEMRQTPDVPYPPYGHYVGSKLPPPPPDRYLNAEELVYAKNRNMPVRGVSPQGPYPPPPYAVAPSFHNLPSNLVHPPTIYSPYPAESSGSVFPMEKQKVSQKLPIPSAPTPPPLVSDIPASVVPTLAAQCRFRTYQWALLRTLMLRRYTQIIGDYVDPTVENLRIIAQYFDISTRIALLVSRPRKKGVVPSYEYNDGDTEWVTAGPLPSPLFLPQSALMNIPLVHSDDCLGYNGTDASLSPSTTSSAGGTPTGTSSSSSDLFGEVNATENKDGLDQSAGAPVLSTADPMARAIVSVSISSLAAELVSLRRFKTKLCHSWLRSNGKCKRGDKCDYAHGAEELRSAVESTRQEKYKQRLCGIWLDTCGEYCPHDDHCSFAHGVHDLRIRLRSAASRSSETESSGPESRVPSAPGVEDAPLLEADFLSPSSSDPPETASSNSGASAAPSTVHSSAVGIGFPLISTPSPGLAGVAGLTSQGGSPPSSGRFKPTLCFAWLANSARAVSRLIAENLGDPASPLQQSSLSLQSGLLPKLSSVIANACPLRAACPHAHGIVELRLPSVLEQQRTAVQLLNDPVEAAYIPSHPLSDSEFSSAGSWSPKQSLQNEANPDDPSCLSPKQQTLLFLSSTLMVGALPANLLHDLSSLLALSTAGSSSHSAPPNSASPSAFGISSVTQRLGLERRTPIAQRALCTLALSPLLRIVMPAFTTQSAPGNGNTNSATGTAAHDSAASKAADVFGEANASMRSISRIAAVVGNDAADLALLAAAIATGLVTLAVPSEVAKSTYFEVERSCRLTGAPPSFSASLLSSRDSTRLGAIVKHAISVYSANPVVLLALQELQAQSQQANGGSGAVAHGFPFPVSEVHDSFPSYAGYKTSHSQGSPSQTQGYGHSHVQNHPQNHALSNGGGSASSKTSGRYGSFFRK